MLKNMILISKDAQLAEYYPPYKHQYYKTPNIDELAAKGTVFCSHYTAAPSTAMAFTSMFTGKYGYQTERKKYVEVDEYEGDTLFDQLEKRGYSNHIIWDKSYVHLAQRFSKCYGKNTVIHNTDFLTHPQPKHINGKFDDLTYHKELEDDMKEKYEKLVCDILSSDRPIFLWVHFPHVLSGRNAYGSDVDLYDEVVGMMRKYFSDDCIFLTADHGHMNGKKGKYGYGFDLHNSSIKIPLITPRIDGMERVEFNTSNIQLTDIILDRKIESKDILYSETAYYMQPHRKIAVISGNYKYIYEKATKKEYLYDVKWDPDENHNLLATEFYDTDRRISYSATQRYFYPYWDDAKNIAPILKKAKDDIWRDAPLYIEIKEKALFRAKMIYQKLKK